MKKSAFWLLLLLLPISILAQSNTTSSPNSREKSSQSQTESSPSFMEKSSQSSTESPPSSWKKSSKSHIPSSLSSKKKSSEDQPKPPHVYNVATYINYVSDINYRDGEYKLGLLVYITSSDPRPFDTLLIQKLTVRGTKEYKIENVPLFSKPDRPALTNRKLYRIDCTMIHDWNMNNYPFGDQQLDVWVYPIIPLKYVVLKDSAELRFPEGGDKLRYDIGNGMYFLKNLAKVHTDCKVKDLFGRTDSLGNEYQYSALHYEMPLIDDRPELLFIKLFLGMYVAFLVAFIALFIPVESEEPRFGLPVGGLFAAVANKYIIEALLPVSTKYTLVDTLHSITIVFILLIIAYSALLIFLNNSKKDYELVNGRNKFFVFRGIREMTMDLNMFNSAVVISLTVAYVMLNLYYILDTLHQSVPVATVS